MKVRFEMKRAAVLVCMMIPMATFAKDPSRSKDGVEKSSAVKLGADKEKLGELLSEALASYVKKSGKRAGIGQGWAEYYMGIRCAIPENTDDPNDKPTCAFVDIK